MEDTSFIEVMRPLQLKYNQTMLRLQLLIDESRIAGNPEPIKVGVEQLIQEEKELTLKTA